jgi:hypothetical protein
MKNLSSPIGNIASNFWWGIPLFSQNEFCEYESHGNCIGEGRGGEGRGGGGLFPSNSQPKLVYTVYQTIYLGHLGTNYIHIFSKRTFFGKSRFVLNIQEFSILANMCQRCQGSNLVYTIYLPHCGRESISDPIQFWTVLFKSWYVTTISVLLMDFTCFSGGHQFRHFLLTRSKLWLTGAT